VSRRPSCYGRRTTCSVREDKHTVCSIVVNFHVNTFYIYTDKIFWDKLWNFTCLRRLQHENLHVILDIWMTYLIPLNKDNDSFCTVSMSTCKLGGSRRPQSPTVICLSEESDIASYFVDISLMFAICKPNSAENNNFLCANGKSKLV